MHALGPYVLIRKIGRGGMAEIYLARRQGPEGFTKTVALKCILPHLATTSEFVTMFLDEARLAARLNHPNIVQIYDFGVVDQTYFIAMEYVPGEDLATVVAQAAKAGLPPPPIVVAAILSGACDALNYAHHLADERGKPLRLIHRDVTPSNLLISFDGVVKLADFGIARAEHRIGHTQTGGIKGKYAYMAPEYLFEQIVDGRNDLFSVGVLGYELLAGKRPFESGNTPESLRAAHNTPIVPLSQLCTVPRELEAIVMRALERDPSRRYPSAHDMHVDLERYMVSTATIGVRLQVAEYMRALFGSDRVEQRRKAAAGELPEAEQTGGVPGGGEEDDAMTRALGDGMASLPWGNAGVGNGGTRATGTPAGDFTLAATNQWIGGGGGETVMSTRSAGLPPEPPAEAEAPARPSSRRWWLVVVGGLIGGGAAAVVARPWEERSVSDGAGDAAAVALAPIDAAMIEATPPVDAGLDAGLDARPPRAVDAGTGAVRPPRTNPNPNPEGRDATLSIKVSPAAEVLLDGKRLGRSPIRQPIRPGRHRISLVTGQGCRTSYEINASPGQLLEQERLLRPAQVSVIVDPWADIYVAGKRIDQTPAIVTLSEGECTLTLTNPESKHSKTVKVSADPNRVTVVRASLHD